MALVGPIRIRVQTKPRIRCRVLPRLIPLNATVAVNSVTTLPPGSPATVSNSGTPSAVELDFGIPQGAPGEAGAPGVVQSIVAGTNVSVNSSDPANPVVSVSGGGDFTGPGSSTADNIVTFAGTTGKAGKDSGIAVSSLAPKNNAIFTGTTTLAADPALALQAATKQYVDNVAAGLDVKPSARLATTANITLSGTQTIDGVSAIAGDRVVVKNQTTTSQNGVYVVAAGVWTRAADMDSWLEVPGANVWIEEGTTNADTAWVCTSNAGGTIGTTAISWTQFGGSGAYQPLDSDLSAIASLTTAAYGRSFLTFSDYQSFLFGAGFEVPLLAANTAAANTTILQNAINTASNTTVHLPPGRFPLNSVTLKPGVRLRGKGKEVTVLLCGSNSINVLQYTAATTQVGFAIVDIGFDANSTTGSTAVSIDGATSAIRISEVSLLHVDAVGFARGIYLHYCANTQLTDLFISVCADAITIDNCADTDLLGCRAQNGSGVGFKIIGGVGAFDEGVRIAACSTNGQNVGLQIDTQDWGDVSGSSFTTCAGGAVIGLNTVSNWKFVGCDISTATGTPAQPNLTMSTGCTNWSIVGCNIALGTFGAIIRGTNHTITGNTCFANSNIDIYLDGATGCSVTGNVCTSTTASWSILENGAADNNVIDGNRTAKLVTIIGPNSYSFYFSGGTASIGPKTVAGELLHLSQIDNTATTEFLALGLEGNSTANSVGKLVSMNFYGRDTVNARKNTAAVKATPLDSNWTNVALVFYANISSALTEVLRIGAKQIALITGSLSRASPVTKTADFTVADTENWLINNKAAATCTVTLPAAASYVGREIMIKNLQAFTVVSASSNVVPLAGGAAATAILAATTGKYATLVSDGTNWVIMAAN